METQPGEKKRRGISKSKEQAEHASEESYHKLLRGNKEWVQEKLSADPLFFDRLVHVQKPDYLLIGCSDSRVPPDQLTKTQPGEIFIHRNVANLVVNTDLNVMSVLQYAVDVLQVKHVIVLGHSNCGGIKTALFDKRHHGLIDQWLRNIRDVYRLHQKEVDDIQDEDAKLHRLVELNVIEQTLNLCKTPTIQKAWARGLPVHVHGWVYDLSNGIIHDLEIEEKAWTVLEPIYKIEFPELD